MKIKMSTARTFLLALCICQGVLIKWGAEYFQNYAIIQRVCLLIGVCCLFPYINVLAKKKYLTCNAILLLTITSIMTSAIINRNNFNNSIVVAMTYAIQLVFLLFYFEYLDSTNQKRLGIRCLFYIICFYCVVTDILMIIDPHRTVYAWGGYSDSFFVGDKFNVTYLHFLCLILYFLLEKENIKKKKIRTVFVLWTIIVSIYTECSTMILGIIVFTMLMIFKEKIIKTLYNPIFACITFLICDTIIIFNKIVLNLPIVQYIIESILNESVELTGRINIYMRLGAVLRINPLFGVGIDNNYEAAFAYTSAADLQNGALDIILSYGWVGLMILIIFLVFTLRQSKYNIQPVLIMAIYIFILFSSVEITFRTYFYLLLILINFYSWEKSNQYGITEQEMKS